MLLPGVNPVYVWLAVVILTIVVEAFSLNLTSIWFGVGALAALVTASLRLGLGVQLVVFVAVSALLLALVRPFTRKFLRVRGEKTNADRIVGQMALVTLEINNALSQGQVSLMGQIWTARSTDGTVVPVGEQVRVLSISGVKAIVEPCSKPAE